MSRSGRADGTLPRTDWERVRAMSEEEVTARAQGDPDAPPLDDAFFERAKLLQPPVLGKRHTGLRIDADVLDWFKAQGKGWQTRMNAVLRAYMEGQRRGT
jgi:uncharacterized protein (DUF4415 family)